SVGLYWKEFRGGLFDDDNALLLSTDKRDFNIAFIIDKYILFNYSSEKILSQKIYSNIKLDDLYAGTGYYMYYVSKYINYDVIKPFYKLFLYSYGCLLYLNCTKVIDIRTLIDFINTIFKAINMARDIAMDMVKSMAMDMTRGMAMAMDMVGRNMDIDMAMDMAGR
ncbi:MAG: hypothetical protein HQK96_10330, partial [Nitrospirae bacterium]|nr:hypothetical protein [Nitrospirota bacterium]